MATGGLALLLSAQPYTFNGLRTIGKVVYIFDLAVFALITVAITYRFYHFPYTLRASLTHPTEGLFMPTSLLAVASILACIPKYAIPSTGPWLVTAHFVLFWLYFTTTFCTGVAHYYLLFTSPKLKIQDMTPAWDLPIFPFMLSGTIAASGAPYQTPSRAMSMIVGGLTAQGLGFLVSILMFASYVRRMIQYGFPSPASRPGMFISVGPPSFTALALIGMANAYPRTTPGGDYFGSNEAVTRQVVLILATFSGVFIWSLSLWFFAISFVSILAVFHRLKFHLNWWAFVFPNVGFTVATIDIAKVFRSRAMQWIGSVMSIGLIATYLFVGFMHCRAVCKKQIMWSGLDEDVHVNEDQAKRRREARDVEKHNEADEMLRQRKAKHDQA